MGEMADYYADLALQEELDGQCFNEEYADEIWIKYQKGKLKWHTKDGSNILIKDMLDGHILNTKKFIERMPSTDAASEWLDVFNAEIEKRKLNQNNL